jgi:hypothetical protein
MKKKFFAIGIAVIGVLLLLLGKNLIETNKVGHIQVKQAAVSGIMSVKMTPGTYWQGFGDITDYDYSDAIYLSEEEQDGGEGADVQAISVLFPDGSCDVDFVGQYEVQAPDSIWLRIIERYPTKEKLKSMVRQQIIEAITNTSSLMNAEDAYSSKRADFISLCREQLIHGLYKPTYVTVYDTIQGGQIQETRIYSVLTDEENNPIIAKEPLLGKYSIVFSQFNIKRLHNFDSRTVELIDKRKEAKAMQQAAITAKAKGEKEIAEKKATQEALKIEEVTKAEKVAAVAVIEAEKLFMVAEFGAKEAIQEKAKKIAIAEGIAEELRIADGLSERDKYQIDADVKRDIGVAEHMSKWIGPQIVMTGGNDSKGGSGIEKALMIQMMSEFVKNPKKGGK